ncbi:endonuclease domain-containing protein [Phenylobacterium sp.]|uniref:endonuclease domain-containing protein n=1 Tax=Phenylobacterium sp. TaxID=1871053 RepID=UPI0039C96E8C
MSLPEVLLRKALKGRKLSGLHFRKQHPVGPYVLYFFCEARRLAVDGGSHSLGDRPGRDERRDAWLRDRGIDTAAERLAYPGGRGRCDPHHPRASRRRVRSLAPDRRRGLQPPPSRGCAARHLPLTGLRPGGGSGALRRPRAYSWSRP